MSDPLHEKGLPVDDRYPFRSELDSTRHPFRLRAGWENSALVHGKAAASLRGTARVGLQRIAGEDKTIMASHETKALIDNESVRWRSLVAATPAVIYARRPYGDFAVFFVGDNVEERLGYGAGEFLASSGFWAERLHPQDKERAFGGLSALLGRGRHSHEYRFLHKNGTYLWICDEFKLLRDEKGEPLEIVGSMLDISPRKALEGALFESQERFLRLVNLISGAVWVDREGRIDFINCAGLRLLGAADQAEVLGRSPLDFIHSDFHPLVREATARMLATGDAEAPVQEKVIRIDGAERDVEVAATPFQDGNARSILMALCDLTEQKRAERDLRRSEERYRILVEMHPDPLLIWKDSRIMYANWAAMELFGATNARQIIDRDPLELVHPDSRAVFQKRIEALRTPGVVVPLIEEKVTRFDGSVRDVDMIAGSFRDDGITAIQVVVRDITERRREQRQLKESNERLRELASALERVREEERGRLARELHDELAQLLTALRMDASWIRRNALKGAGQVIERADAMTELINRVASNTRRIATELRPKILDDLGLIAAIRSVAAETSKRSRIECRVISKADGPTIPDSLATPMFRMVQEALTNIARHSSATSATITLTLQDDALTVLIRDNGRGLSENDLRKNGCFGLLGMRERAAAIGGTVKILSNPGEGTTIEIRVPLSQVGTAS